MDVLVTLFSLTLLLQFTHADIFTSMANMEMMVLHEKQMLLELKDYISAEEKKIKEVKDFMSRLNNVMKKLNTSEDVDVYLGNPVNSYLMLKRFNIDWKKLEKIVEVDLTGSFNTALETVKPFFPTQKDHEGAMDAMLRLQSIYKLHAEILANGKVPGTNKFSAQSLNNQDVFELGSRAYVKEDWPHAIQWFSVALERLANQNTDNHVEKANVIDHLAYSFFAAGKTRKAYNLTVELNKIRPNDDRVKDNLEFFRREINNLEDDNAEDNDIDDEDIDDPIDYTVDAAESMDRRITKKKYRKLCRGEIRALTKKEQRRLKCWYRQNNPLLLLKPQKVERLWVHPEIFLFHDIVQDNEVQWIKDTAYPRLRRAVIQDPLTDELKIADYRISKSAWLSAQDYPEVKRLQRRAAAVTGLDMEFAEQLQIADYGIGGQYEPHFDHATRNEDRFTSLGMGNRIATLLFYLSNVEAGGATVFTNAETAVYPVKNAAVFWFNLKRNGGSNDLTRHAGCPVLAGHKWISNWWIHEYGQESRRPCDVDRNW